MKNSFIRVKDVVKFLVIIVILVANTTPKEVVSKPMDYSSFYDINEYIGRLTQVHDDKIATLIKNIDNFYDVYGGSYFNESYELIVTFVDSDSEAKKMINDTFNDVFSEVSENITIKYVTNSFSEINNAYNYILENDFVGKDDILEAYISYTENSVVLVLSEEVDLANQIHLLKQPFNYIFHINESIFSNKSEVVETATIRGGERITFSTNNNSCSSGFVAFSQHPRKSGFVTAAHCATNGSQVNYKGSNIGTITSRILNNSNDSAFVELSDYNSTLYQYVFSGINKSYNTVITLSLPIEGSPLTISGQYSNKITSLISNNASIFGSLSWTNMLKFDNVTVAGDSGGIILTTNSSGLFNAVGIVRGYWLSSAYGTPSRTIMQSHNLTN
mgnify:FL=1